MATKTEKPPIEFLRKYFAYDKDTGGIIRIPGQVNSLGRPVNKGVNKPVAGRDAEGYLRTWVVYGGKQHNIKAHQLAWALHYGKWPVGIIDHINRNKSDNRIENLRIVNENVNAANRKTNRSLPVGVSVTRNKAGIPYGFRVNCCFLGKKLRADCKTLEQAIAKRKEMEDQLFPSGTKQTN